MTQYFSPGVYIKEVPPQLRAIEGVSTSVAGFVGFAARGPVAGFPLPFMPGLPTGTQPLLLLVPPDSAPVLVTSLSDYTRSFGPLPATPSTNNRNFLGHSVRAFFDNGGQLAYVARVVANQPSPATAASNAYGTLIQGSALRLTAKAKSGTSTVSLDSLRGISGGSSLSFTTPSSGTSSTHTVVAYNTQSGTVTLSSPLMQDYTIDDTVVTVGTVAPQTISGVGVTAGQPTITFSANLTLGPTALVFASQPGATYFLDAVANAATGSLTTNYTGPTATTTATVPNGPQFYARSPGSWGTNIQVLVSNSDEAPTQITAAVAGSNVIPVQTTASFYPGAILEVDHGGGNGTREYFTVVQIVSSSRVQVDRALTLTLPSGGPVAGTVNVISGSTTITFSTPPTLAAGTPLVFASQPGVQYFLASNFPAAPPTTTGTLTVAYSGTSNSSAVATISTIPPFARVVEIDITIVDTASGTTETYQGLTWGINTTVWSSIQSSVQSRHYANVINTQSSLVYVQPPSVPVIPPTAILAAGTEAFAVSSGTVPLSYQPQSFSSAGAILAFAFPQTLASGGSDGAPLVDDDFIGIDNGPGLRTGIQALQDVTDISIIAVPGETSNPIQQALITQCETMVYRFAVLDGQLGPPNDVTTIQNHRNNYASSYAGYYVPWVQIENSAGTATIDLPPAGYVMGVYARVDNSRGVWKAPANEPLQNVTGLQSYITKGEQDILNPVGVDCIRRFPGRGILVWGARTLSTDPQFDYVNVRRYMIFLEASLDQGTQWVVFEPNSPPTWSRVVDSVTAFLDTQWRAGALFGAKPEDAFYVRCDQTTMSADDVQSGRLICDIGVAIVRPAEFVIFRIEQITGFSSSTT